MIPASKKQSRESGSKSLDRRKSVRLVNRPYLNSKNEKCYRVTVYEGGNLVRLEGPKFESLVKYEEGRSRGKIADFSVKSRQRLMRKIAMIDRREAGLPVFLTLTYPAEWPGGWEDWKKQLHKFKVYLARRFPDVWGVWKMEFQKRGAPHFHFMLWGLPKIHGTEHLRSGKTCWRVLPGISRPTDLEVFEWVNGAWYRIVGSGDENHLKAGINLEPVQSWKGVTSYVSKYLGKTQGGEFVPCENTGRFWGVIQGQKWAITKLSVMMGEGSYFRYMRVLRKMRERAAKRVRKEARAKGYQIPQWAQSQALRGRMAQGMHAYLDSLDGVKLIAWAAG